MVDTLWGLKMTARSVRARANQKIYQKEWQQKNRIRLNENSRERMKKFRVMHGISYITFLTKRYKVQIFNFFSNKCGRCGVADARLLQIHHVKGGGTKERDGLDYLTYYRKIFKSLQTNPNDYKLLCANCHILIDLKDDHL